MSYYEDMVGAFNSSHGTRIIRAAFGLDFGGFGPLAKGRNLRIIDLARIVDHGFAFGPVLLTLVALAANAVAGVDPALADEAEAQLTFASIFDSLCVQGIADPGRLAKSLRGTDIQELKPDEYNDYLYGKPGIANKFYDVSVGADRSTIIGRIVYDDGAVNCAIDFRGDSARARQDWLRLYRKKYTQKGRNKLQFNKNEPFYFAEIPGTGSVMVQIGEVGGLVSYYAYYRK